MVNEYRRRNKRIFMGKKKGQKINDERFRRPEKTRTYAVLKETLLSRALKTLTPGLTLNTKAHLMYFNLIPGYKPCI